MSKLKARAEAASRSSLAPATKRFIIIASPFTETETGTRQVERQTGKG